ncbi:MAG: hypothetical protein ABJN84_13650 [Flavobacteriaceae bacterium]
MERKSKILLIIGIILVIISPWIFAKNSFLFSFDENSGYIGDTIGGITAPIANIIASVLIYFSFTEQIKANNILREDSFLKTLDNRYSEIKAEFRSVKFPEDELHEILSQINFESTLAKYVADFDERKEGNIRFEYHFKYVLYLITYFIEEIESSSINMKLKKNVFKRLYQFYYARMEYNLGEFIDFSHKYEYNEPITELIVDVKNLMEQKRKEYNIPDPGKIKSS